MKTTASSAVWVSESNGQLLTHFNHLGTHLDGEIHFFTAGKDTAQLELNDFLVGPGVVVDLSDATGDYQIYTAAMIEEVMARKAQLPQTRFGDGYNPEHVEQIDKLTERF